MMQQFTLDVAPDIRPTLSNFFPVGNEALHQHLRLWISTVKRSPVPLYIWGASGTGKTHLVHAVAHALNQRCEPFGVIDSHTTEPAVFNPAWRVVLLDDVHLFNAIQQHAAFNWFINSQSHACAVFATGDKPPSALTLRDDLRSRLGWGDIYALQTLSDQAQREVLTQSAAARGLHLGNDVLDYMNTRFARDLGNLMQWLDKLDQYALQTKRPITVPLLKDMLQHIDQLVST